MTKEAAQLRDFLNRGGFLMVDDFHGSSEWEVFGKESSRYFRTGKSSIFRTTSPFFTPCTTWTTSTRFRARSTSIGPNL